MNLLIIYLTSVRVVARVSVETLEEEKKMIIIIIMMINVPVTGTRETMFVSVLIYTRRSFRAR